MPPVQTGTDSMWGVGAATLHSRRLPNVFAISSQQGDQVRRATQHDLPLWNLISVIITFQINDFLLLKHNVIYFFELKGWFHLKKLQKINRPTESWYAYRYARRNESLSSRPIARVKQRLYFRYFPRSFMCFRDSWNGSEPYFRDWYILLWDIEHSTSSEWPEMSKFVAPYIWHCYQILHHTPSREGNFYG